VGLAAVDLTQTILTFDHLAHNSPGETSMTRFKILSCSLLFVANTAIAADITEDSFGCITDMQPVRGFFVDNLDGNIDATLAAARSETGGVYPPGSVVQLVPGEAMVKRAAGFNAATKDWEFFELDASAEGTAIRVRGFADVVNRFGGNCLACHAKANPERDMICEQGHGCDPLPLTPAMVSAIQKTDPRCAPTELTTEEAEALKALMAAIPAPE
jgi:hypothetical protein